MLLSICCITYNQERFIAQAIEGFLMQKTLFPIEIIIHDDASTDNTAVIINDYSLKYPNIIFPIYQKENQYSKGINPGFAYVIPKCKGKYIAVCEGDDYWTDPNKLQKQVDFMENNPDFAVCCHEVLIINEISGKKKLSKLNQKPVLTIYDILETPLMHTPSLLFRNYSFNKLPNWFHDLIVGDYPLLLLLAQKGKIKYFPEVMAVYRIHSQGTWEKQTYDFKREIWIDMLRIIKNKYNPEINNQLTKYYYNSIWSQLIKAIAENDDKKCDKYASYIIQEGPQSIIFFAKKVKFLNFLRNSIYLKTLYKFVKHVNKGLKIK